MIVREKKIPFGPWECAYVPLVCLFCGFLSFLWESRRRRAKRFAATAESCISGLIIQLSSLKQIQLPVS